MIICNFCRGTRVSSARWVDPNTMEILPENSDYDYIMDADTGQPLAHCKDCDTFTTLIDTTRLFPMNLN